MVALTFIFLAACSLAYGQGGFPDGIIRLDGVGPNDVQGISNLRQSCESLSNDYYGFTLTFEASSLSNISWAVVNEAGSVVISRSAYFDFGIVPEGLLRKRIEYFCLPEGCYTFVIRDSSTPCCDDGYFSLTTNTSTSFNEVIIEDDHSSESTISFCTSDIERCRDNVRGVVAYYDFEDNQNGWLCGGFGNISTCTYISSANNNPLEGNGSLRISGNGVAASPLLAYTPAPNFQYRVKFLATTAGYDIGDQYSVEIRNANGVSISRTFTFGDDFQNESIVELSEDITNNGEAGFFVRGESSNPNAQLWIDNFAVEEVPICVETFTGVEEPIFKFSERAQLVKPKNMYRLKVYPNPVSSSEMSVFYFTNGKPTLIRYSIYSSNGQIVSTGNLLSNTSSLLDLSSIRNGMYLLRIHDQVEIASKIIIKK